MFILSKHIARCYLANARMLPLSTIVVGPEGKGGAATTVAV